MAQSRFKIFYPKLTIINIPQTTTFLALIVLFGMWHYNDQSWKELTMMVLSFYFGKAVPNTTTTTTNPQT